MYLLYCLEYLIYIDGGMGMGKFHEEVLKAIEERKPLPEISDEEMEDELDDDVISEELGKS